MSGLREMAQALGLTAAEPIPGELAVECEESRFGDLAAQLCSEAFLSDLFASTTSSQPRLTAIFSTIGDPGWLRLETVLSADSYSALTPRIHGASWYEREIAEMFGIVPQGHPSPRRLRLHDWPRDIHPMRDPVETPLPSAEGADALPRIRGQGVFQLPLGPVRSGPQESAEFLFNSGGEDLVMVSPRLGYKFRAVERLAEGRDAASALILAERLAGISTFSNALAFVQAVERVGGVEISLGSAYVRCLLNELERLHSHLGSLARVADSTGLTVAAAQYNLLREEVLHACSILTGHRYLRGILAIGGLAIRPSDSGRQHLGGGIKRWRKRAAQLERMLEDTATFIDRLETTAILPSGYAHQHYLVGPIGRSSGVDRDCRRDHPYAQYGSLTFDVLVKSQGDALARVRVLLFEIGQALGLIEHLLDLARVEGAESARPEGPGSALGWAEAPGGEALHHVELDGAGHIRRWRARPPAVINWHPYAYACASGNNLTDYPVIEASFSLSIAEFDR
jgi:Ni,Fe-hydrogenase III large subunit/Ni,Fe-hydrogenase III component G